MAYTHSISYIWGNGNSSLSSVVSATADSEQNFDIVANNTTVNSGNTSVAVTIAPANIKSVYISTDNPVTITFTITSGTPSSLVVTLAANTSYQWIFYTSGPASPFGSTGNITATTIANTSATINPNVHFRFLVAA